MSNEVWQRLRRRRTDGAGWSYARIVSVLVVVVMAAITAEVAVELWSATTGDRLAAPLAADLDPDLVATDLPEGMTAIELVGRVEVITGLPTRLLWWAANAAPAASVVVFLELLRRVTRSHDGPFVPVNLARLRMMAAAALTTFLLIMVRETVGFALEAGSGLDRAAMTVDAAPLAFCLLILTISEVWSRGVELQADAELTV